MNRIHELEAILGQYLAWDKRRLKCFLFLVLGVLQLNTVNLLRLSELAVDTLDLSRHRRFQRFFSSCKLDFDSVAKLIFHLCGFRHGKHYLIFDRTNWKWGNVNINILFLCLSYKGHAMPILWILLPHRGNSATTQRVALIKRFLKLFRQCN